MLVLFWLSGVQSDQRIRAQTSCCTHKACVFREVDFYNMLIKSLPKVKEPETVWTLNNVVRFPDGVGLHTVLEVGILCIINNLKTQPTLSFPMLREAKVGLLMAWILSATDGAKGQLLLQLVDWQVMDYSHHLVSSVAVVWATQ